MNVSEKTCLIIFLSISLFVSIILPNRPLFAQIPEVGAQVWLEPGQKKSDIDIWFQRLSEHNMKITRIFMQWNFIEKAPNQWDFEIYDAAFESAEKYNINIVATLMPNFPPPHKGGYYKTQDGAIAQTWRQLNDSKKYIEVVVNRYKNHPALHAWMLMNEPGQLPSNDSLAIYRFKEYLIRRYNHIESLNASWLANFKQFDDIYFSPNWSGGGFTWPVSYVDWQTFWREHLSWYLEQIAHEIRKYDSNHALHVNPHALLDILKHYDLPSWRNFLSTLGASIHPVWHFSDLKRNQYPLGVSWVCDLVKGAAEPLPFWTTELQGGHNIYSADVNVCPNPNEIAAWLWTSIASGAEKTIFWCLNPRNKGTEAGEWAMLDYAHQPTDRFKTAGKIAQILQDYKSFFHEAKAMNDPITIIISLETLTLQERARRKDQNPQGRGHKTHYFGSMACYRALMQQGWMPQIKHLHDYDWLAKSATPRVAILADAEALTNEQIEMIHGFVANGNHLIILGNTGFFDETEGARPHTQRYFNTLVGGELRETTQVNEVKIVLDKVYQLPVAGYGSLIQPSKGKKISDTDSHTVAIENRYGKGTVFWLPFKVDVGAWFMPTANFNQLLNHLASRYIKKQAPLMLKTDKNLIHRHMQHGDSYLSMLHYYEEPDGKSASVQRFHIKTKDNYEGKIIFGNPTVWDSKNNILQLKNRETIVILWTSKTKPK